MRLEYSAGLATGLCDARSRVGKHDQQKHYDRPRSRPDGVPVNRDTLLALGLLLTTATQLRPGGSPIGPGEICLVVWIMSMVGSELARSGLSLTPALSHLLIFWALFVVAESLGTLAGLAIGDRHDPSLFLHDIFAYPLVAAFSCLSVVEPGAGLRLRRVAWLMVTLGAVFLIPQLVAALTGIDLPLIEPWFGDRFRGWSNNPNQLAFLCAVLVLTAVHLADTTSRAAGWVTAIVCAIPAFWIGRLTKTDTFVFSLVVACGIFFGVKVRVWLVSAELRLTPRSAVALITIVAVPLMLASAAPFMVSAIADPQGLAIGLTKNGGKEASREADLRLELWREAISRGLESRMLGLGPGPHLPIPASIVAARQTEPDLDTGDHPTVNDTPNFEAHNTPLDLFTQGGLIAIFAFAWILVTAFVIVCRARLAGLAALLCGLAIFSLTNMIVRPPIFWFGIALCLVVSDVTRRSNTMPKQLCSIAKDRGKTMHYSQRRH